MKLYLLEWVGVDESEVIGIYSTSELAHNAKPKICHPYEYFITEIELDKDI